MLPISDLDSILLHTEGVWEPLREKRVFLTGGTGFIGKWLIESFLHANRRLDLGASMHVLSRDPKAFLSGHPWLSDRTDLRLIEGDVRSFEFPRGEFSHIVHAATSSSDPVPHIETFDTVVGGTRRVLDFSRRSSASHFLFLSSGAVYGRQPSSIKRIPESFTGAPMTTLSQSAYGEGKRAAEWLLFEFGHRYGMSTFVARCFAFIGPYLPLDRHYAIGNFIRDAFSRGPIRINADGAPFRSYLYASDLAIWLWTILLKGQSGEPYNVGSDMSLTIKELATLVAEIMPAHPDVLVTKASVPGAPAERYVPSIDKARTQLGLDVWTSLDESIRKTMDWIGKQK